MLRCSVLALVLIGCSSAPEPRELRTGTVVGGTGPLPGAIAGLRYQTGRRVGFTDADGRFTYRVGDDVGFALGALQFRPTAGRDRISPFQLANGSGCGFGAELTAVLQLLQSADQDGDPDNGIGLPELDPVDPPQPVSELADLGAALQAVRPGATLVAADVALDRFVRQVDDEAWAEAGDDDTFAGWDALFRSQGAASDGQSWFFSSTTHLERTDAAFAAQADNLEPIPDDLAALGNDHIGDIDVYDGLLYAPVEDGPAYQHPFVVTYDAATLAPTGDRYPMPQALLTEGIPWVAVDPDRQRVYAAEWDPTERIQRFDLGDDLALVDALELSQVLGRLQGAKVFGGALYATSDDAEKSVFKIDLDTGAVLPLFTLGTPGSELEGLAPVAEPDGAHLRILNVVVPNVVFSDWVRTRDPLRDDVCP